MHVTRQGASRQADPARRLRVPASRSPSARPKSRSLRRRCCTSAAGAPPSAARRTRTWRSSTTTSLLLIATSSPLWRRPAARYVQLDDTNLAYLCDPKMREGARQRGDDPDELPRRYARLINAAIADRPAGMTVCTHLCRGNFKSAWVGGGRLRAGRRSAVQRARGRRLLSRVRRRALGRLRAAAVSCRRTRPSCSASSPPKSGSSNRRTTSNAGSMKRRATSPLEQLCLSPQCGFSSTVHGNDIARESQAAKIRLVVETASEVWG